MNQQAAINYLKILCFSLSILACGHTLAQQDSFVGIEAGKFVMGSPDHEPNRHGDEKRHWVTLTQNIQMQATEVTQRQYLKVMKYNPSYFRQPWHCGEDHSFVNGYALCPYRPVESVSWFDVQRFIARLNEGQDQYLYRLPTEAEWEYAARAGTETTYNVGYYISPAQANYNGQAAYTYSIRGVYRGQTVAVAIFDANAWGLYDMHGNVREWVYDAYGSYYYGERYQWVDGAFSSYYFRETRPREFTDPQGAQVGPGRVVRGGGWASSAASLRSAYRDYHSADDRQNDLGFRLARVLLQPAADAPEASSATVEEEDATTEQTETPATPSEIVAEVEVEDTAAQAEPPTDETPVSRAIPVESEDTAEQAEVPADVIPAAPSVVAEEEDATEQTGFPADVVPTAPSVAVEEEDVTEQAETPATPSEIVAEVEDTTAQAEVPADVIPAAPSVTAEEEATVEVTEPQTVLASPALSSYHYDFRSESFSFAFTLSGVASGDQVDIFTDADCTALAGSAVSSEGQVKVPLSSLSAGVYSFYTMAHRGDESSACSQIWLNFTLRHDIL